MTILEQLIEESSAFEKEISLANETGKLSKRAGQVLLDECIKMVVAVQTRNVLMEQQRASADLVVPGMPQMRSQ